MCVEPSEQGSFFKMIDLRGYMPRFTLKTEHSPIYLLGNPINVCWTLRPGLIFLRTGLIFPYWKPHKCVLICRTGLVFPRRSISGGHMPRFTLKTEHFPIYLLGNPINVCWNPQNRARFSETIDLRGHMPRFTLKKCTFRTALIFRRQSIWGVTCLVFTLKQGTFSHIYLLGISW